ncbi:MAG: CRISPR-associated protein Cse1 [Pseudomonadota bacterium]
MYNLLTDQIIRFETAYGLERGSLPDVYAALMRDDVESFPAMRAHQEPAWHMFLAQLGAIAAHRGGLTAPPEDAETWRTLIGNLTRKEFPNDEPWRLIVVDWSKPAFLQSPVPGDVALKNEARTPDALDMLITSRNHDVKQEISTLAELDDWIFALVSLQTMEGYGGPKNYGIARMNGGSSSRVMMGLTAMTKRRGQKVLRPGQRLKRDALQLKTRRDELLNETPIPYPKYGGTALIWTLPWHDNDQISLSDLDICFIEICRRVRLQRNGCMLMARTGNSCVERIKAKHLKGCVGDPWSPLHRIENKSLTIGDEGTFDYTRVVNLLLSGDWSIPLLAQLGQSESNYTTSWVLHFAAIARGNSKTGGFRSRALPLKGRIARGLLAQRPQLHELANKQIQEIKKIDTALRNALALATAGGDREKVDENSRLKTRPYRERFDTVADRLFFPALWARFEAQQTGTLKDAEQARRDFLLPLIDAARDLLEEGIADVPCASIRRPRAAARAQRTFEGRVRSDKHGFPALFANDQSQFSGNSDAA